MANNSGTQQMFKKNLYMMDSMTDAELDGKVMQTSNFSQMYKICMSYEYQVPSSKSLRECVSLGSC